ncbi:hypothetical protein PBY51_019756 [Eleginops maclovinus]|uniref:Uncharacterized protein n=1 Tax=Eleginops maclovinus TaxID=56733 RepID=A0AAN7XNN8_ELEMC|nr:hypothetical protein PBY51_019756 [Eleginops maclovinus]
MSSFHFDELQDGQRTPHTHTQPSVPTTSTRHSAVLQQPKISFHHSPLNTTTTFSKPFTIVQGPEQRVE